MSILPLPLDKSIYFSNPTQMTYLCLKCSTPGGPTKSLVTVIVTTFLLQEQESFLSYLQSNSCFLTGSQSEMSS